ncbi:MAG: 50S ribosomal protein L6 [Chloroflexi bacterium]|nr:50S ribosomal protein L6 [Chloroflexota bacterium]
MSRIGRMPIPVPSGITIDITGSLVTVTGARGTLSQGIPDGISVRRDDDQLVVERETDNRVHRSLHGLTRSLINNMVVGISQGFEKRLEIVGTGYRAQIAGDSLSIAAGFSHPVVVKPPEGVTFSMDGPRMVIAGMDKQLVGETAAQIRRLRPPEPYKGKGIRYQGEYVRRKAGKTGSKKR